MKALHKRAISVSAGIAASLVFNSAQALDGYTKVISCSNCLVPTDFRNAAMYDDNDYVQEDLTYTVISASAGMSVYVQVTGSWITDPITGDSYWGVDNARILDQNGGEVSSDVPTAQGQMAVIDVGLFGFSRGNSISVATVTMPASYDGSFINSTDEMDSPGIGYALIQLGINPASFAVGDKILVTYADGTRAVFVKMSNLSSYQWTWDGIHAWAANGTPLASRTGTSASNPNSSGGGGGSTSVSANDSEQNAANLWFIYGQEQCLNKTTITYNGVVLGTLFQLVPC